jgi:hypothetical protein
MTTVLYPQRVSLPFKKQSNGCLAHFFLNLKCAKLPVCYQVPTPEPTSSILKKMPNGHFYLQQDATPDQITQQNSFQSAGGT